MSKHTPGPWEYGVRKNNSIWLSLGDPEKGPHYQGDLYASEADARLIAAAPDLLAVANAILKYNSMDEDDHTALMISYHDVLEKAAAAIAKAEGRS